MVANAKDNFPHKLQGFILTFALFSWPVKIEQDINVNRAVYKATRFFLAGKHLCDIHYLSSRIGMNLLKMLKRFFYKRDFI